MKPASLCRCLDCNFTAVFMGDDVHQRTLSPGIECPVCDSLRVAVLRPVTDEELREWGWA